jgi:hypothetical protein
MSDEYLLNREGEPDPEVLRLENLLETFRYQPPKSNRRRYLAAAAAVIGAIALLPFLWQRGALTSWQLADGQKLRTGQWIETGLIQSPSTGQLEIEPGSRLRLIASAGDGQRFHLERGVIHALIWAPPGRFVVDTPSARTTDLGCSYTLQVAENGDGLLTVQTGWVAFDAQQVESFIPAGAACVTRPGRGPGVPWFTDAPDAFRTSLDKFDTLRDPAALGTVLRTARERDALTLWHLLLRTQGQQRGEVFDHFAMLVHLPAKATKEAVLSGDRNALDSAWDALQLGSTNWWREWKRKW